MADVVVNIRGNTSELQNDLNQIGGQTPPSIPIGGSGQQVPPTGSQQIPSPQTPGGGTPAMPSYDRMAQDIRREILNRGVMMVPGSSNFNQFMNTIQQQQRTSGYQAIDDRYTQRVTATQAYYQQEQEKQLDALEDERREKLKGATTQSGEDRINARYDNKRQQLLDNIQIQQAQAFTQLQTQRDSEKEQLDKDLTKVMRDLIDELKQGNPNSYLGQLRGEYREAIWKRDNAETKEEAIAAAREAADIEQRMMPIYNRGNKLGIIGKIASGWGIVHGAVNALNVIPRIYANDIEKINELNAAANGDVYGVLEEDLNRRKRNWSVGAGAAGAAIGAAVGGYFSGGTAAAVSAGVGANILSTLSDTAFDWSTAEERQRNAAGKLVSDNEQRLMQYSDFANIISSVKGLSIQEARNYLISIDEKGNFYNQFYDFNKQLSNYDLGLNRVEFINQVRQRLLQRGFIERGGELGINSSIESIALEKLYNMSSGSLGQLSTYDRYGNDANQDFTNLVASLNSMNTLGMSNGQTLRANEFMSYQQQLLESQKSWMLNPNSNFAIRQLLAAQSVYGDSLDSRGISDLNRINESIINPKEGAAKYLLYDTILNEFDNVRDIRDITRIQYSQDVNVRQKLLKAYYQRIKKAYGSANTTRGMLALGEILGTNNPYIIENWEKSLINDLPGISTGNVSESIQKMKDYTPESVKASKEVGDQVTSIISTELKCLNEITYQIYVDFYTKIKDMADDIKKISK